MKGGNTANREYDDASGIGTAVGFPFDANVFQTFTFSLNSATNNTFTDNANLKGPWNTVGTVFEPATGWIHCINQSMPAR